jgi:hypothetical protein
MKRRILNLGVSATHDLIATLPHFNHVQSVSDFDAFIFDPSVLQQGGVNPESFFRRQGEIRDLLVRKGGVVICLLRQANPLGFNGLDSYSVLEAAGVEAIRQVRGALRAGWGSHVDLIRDARGPSAAYLRILKEVLGFRRIPRRDAGRLTWHWLHGVRRRFRSPSNQY